MTPSAAPTARHIHPRASTAGQTFGSKPSSADSPRDPAAAARYAVDHMGFYLVHVDGDGRHYLGAHGLDPYSLVYTPGQQGAVDHISYVVRNAADLAQAEKILTSAGIRAERVERSP